MRRSRNFRRIRVVNATLSAVALAISLIFATGVNTSASADAASELRQLIVDARNALEKGEPEKALPLIDRAIDYFDPDKPAHIGNLAFLFNELSVARRAAKQPKRANEAAAKAIELAQQSGASVDQLASYLMSFGLTLYDIGDYGSAEQAFRDATELAREASPEFKRDLNTNLAQSMMAQGRYREVTELISNSPIPGNNQELSEIVVQAYLALRETQFARQLLNDLMISGNGFGVRILDARVNLAEGNVGKAQEVLDQLLPELIEGPLRASALYNRAETDFVRGRFGEAQIWNDRAIASLLSVYGPNHQNIAQGIQRQALIEQEVGANKDALKSYSRAIDLFNESLGADHALTRLALVEEARLLGRIGDTTSAIEQLRNVASSKHENHVDSFESKLATLALGLVNFEQGEFDQANIYLQSVLVETENSGIPPIDRLPGLTALAEISLRNGDADKALIYINKAIEIAETSQLTGVDKLSESRRVLAAIFRMTGKLQEALNLARQNSTDVEERLKELSRVPSYSSEFSPRSMRQQISQHLSLLWDVTTGAFDETSLDELFRTAQLIHLNETTSATNGLVNAKSVGETEVAVLLRKRRDAQERLRALTEAASRTSTHHETIERVNATREEISSVETLLLRAAPEIMSTLTPRTVAVEEVRAKLQPAEALWMQTTFKNETWVFLLDSDGLQFHRANVGNAEIKRRVDQLRTSVDVTGGPNLKPFDFEASNFLYLHLFEPFTEKLEKAQTLRLIPDRALQEISLSTLVKKDAQLPTMFGAGHPEYRYLGLTHALSLVLSPQAFLRMRSSDAESNYDNSFIGFGDPLLDGTSPVGGVVARSPVNSRTGLADPEMLAVIFEPLEETAWELETMAAEVDEAKLFLREAASEFNAKQVNFAGVGAIAFATHAIVAGDFDSLNEPALVLTPPKVASFDDDGLLTASEISKMRIEAEIVILSACNTAAPSGREGAPGLSGLAAAFFDAGAKSVIATHWTIFSYSSILVVPDFFRRTRTDPSRSSSEALRRVQLSVANRNDFPNLDHPAVWAPFSLIGSD